MGQKFPDVERDVGEIQSLTAADRFVFTMGDSVTTIDHEVQLALNAGIVNLEIVVQLRMPLLTQCLRAI
ncbi:hypothetical protein AYJ66_01150 [Dietzia cinnamea]|nr:hypothetical protein AYJ66_01150 [Dietzia cinnamea]